MEYPRHSQCVAVSHMDVDVPPAGESPLKRSNSAPSINLLLFASEDAAAGDRYPRRSSSPLLATRPGGSTSLFHAGSDGSAFRPVELQPARLHERTGHSGGGGSSGSTSSLCTTPVKAISRLHQIKKEEQAGCSAAAAREVAHEREVQSSLQISHSWEEMHLTDGVPASGALAAVEDGFGCGGGGSSLAAAAAARRPRSLSDSLHVLTAAGGGCFPAPSSPSPTVGKQCFSPSMQQPVSAALCSVQSATSPTPSPTRRLFRRSLSPIVSVQPSRLSLKRKLDIESPDNGLCSPKRAAAASAAGPGHIFMLANVTDNRLSATPSHIYEDGSGMAAASRLSFLTDAATSSTDSESDVSSAESGAGSVTESLDDTAPPRQHQQQSAAHAPLHASVGCCRPGMARQTSVP